MQTPASDYGTMHLDGIGIPQEGKAEPAAYKISASGQTYWDDSL
jgi:hypothetical protein